MPSVRFHGHACFLLENGAGETLVIDPLPDEGFAGLNDLAPLRTQARWVLCSHMHADHAAYHLLSDATPIGCSGQYGPWHVERRSAFHDEHGGRLRGGPTDLLRIRFAGLCIVHCGDLGELPGPELLAWLRSHPIDLLLVPAGGWFTLDAADAAALAHELSPRAAAAYHCSDQGLPLPQLQPRLDFLALWEEHERAEAFTQGSFAPSARASRPHILDLQPNRRSALKR